ncbi:MULTISPECIES: diguanylate cyclase [unclassified Meiothermus]|uniref:GGDEF domain-containing protein n=1 Tax=unclassified Meiothermus TaxID=370471 RepID=UPI001314F1CB|nr:MULTISPECIES: GGDEF domain-containing protein [unclassified Meiothermus]
MSDERLRYRVYTAGLLVGAASLPIIWAFQRGQDPFVRWTYPLFFVAALFWLWALLTRRFPVAYIERQTILGTGLMFLGKYAYYFAFVRHLSAVWNELEATVWVFAFLMILFYLTFDSGTGLRYSVLLVVLAALVGAARLVPDLLQGLHRGEFLGWLRDITRISAMAALLYVFSNAKDQLAQAHQRARELHLLAHTDGLTGLLNRLGAVQALEDRLTIPQPFAVVLVDVDHFKSINDRFGHLIGDEILIEVGARLRDALRERDVVGRWGGEEFLLILEAADIQQALGLVERLRTRLAAQPFLEVGTVTVSLGVAVHQPGESRLDLLRRADEALYAAKRQGRNRAVLSPPREA